MCGLMNLVGSLAVAALHAAASADAPDHALIWFSGGQPTSQAWGMAELLRRADEKALRPEDYDGAHWTARLGMATRSEGEGLRRSVDAAFSAAALRYLHDLRWGRAGPPGDGIERARREEDADDVDLRAIARAEDVPRAASALEPPFAGYERTLAALRDYRALAREDPAEPLPVPRRTIRRGDRYAGLPRLVARLRLVGDLTKLEVDESALGADVSAAVARFQRRHGLDAHGRVDAATVARLNVPLAHRVRQLELTIERWRWLPRRFRAPPIVVNLPEFRLHAGGADDRWSMRVVVGRAYRTQTPVFASEITSIVFHPAWNVPRSIVTREIAPRVAREPGYLASHGYELIDALGREVSPPADPMEAAALLGSGAVRVRQQPGPGNALGPIKFVFPNAHDVYMHGTPSAELFARSRRDFSHGCIRVEDPLRLAEWVLRDEPAWPREHIVEAMEGPRSREVRVRNPTPVLIVYGTAVVAEDGTVSFYDDLYGYDAELARALDRGA